MLKQDQPVNVTADELDYDGGKSQATYTGNAQLWQGETSIKGDVTLIDSKNGDLEATGPVATVTILSRTSKDGSKERVRSIAHREEFQIRGRRSSRHLHRRRAHERARRAT